MCNGSKYVSFTLGLQILGQGFKYIWTQSLTPFPWSKSSSGLLGFSSGSCNTAVMGEQSKGKNLCVCLHVYSSSQSPWYWCQQQPRYFSNFSLVLNLSCCVFNLTTVNSILTEIKDSDKKKLKLQVIWLKNQEPTQKKVCNCWLIIPMACITRACQKPAGELSEWESRISASG